LLQAYYAAKGIQLVKGVLAKELKGDAAGKVSRGVHSTHDPLPLQPPLLLPPPPLLLLLVLLLVLCR
jgi:hypothetical protein